MNTAKALKRAFDPSDKLNENLKNQQEQTPKQEPSPLTENPYKVSTVTPILSDMLARFDGVPRWGLNE